MIPLPPLVPCLVKLLGGVGPGPGSKSSSTPQLRTTTLLSVRGAEEHSTRERIQSTSCSRYKMLCVEQIDQNRTIREYHVTSGELCGLEN